MTSPSASSPPPLSPPLGLSSSKVLLLGEHAVVYGQPALAVGIPQGLSASISPPADPLLSSAPCRLLVPTWSNLSVHSDQPDAPVALALRAILSALGLSGHGLTIHVDAQIPPGVGLGSSASLAVALTRALATYHNIPLDFATLDRVCMAAERVFHGAPSGIDHSVAASGGVVRFLKGPILEPLSLASPLHLVIGVAAPGASTHLMVSGVRARVERQPKILHPIIQTIGSLVDLGVAALQTSNWTTLGELMDINHGLLCALGVSTAPLDQAVYIARAAGALGAKLTGAGGGGCIVALAQDPPSQHHIATALHTVCNEVLCPTLT